ncbi:MAG: hypothetical protein RI564_02480 [Gracilimonas sp.]|jgi:Ni,Fe-hydrogenase I small subunit|nr:hypothetical protein [Gracilimonas sp.]
MNKLLLTVVLFMGLLVSGCYHATVETGKPASDQVIEEPFALSFVYGLIPPATVDVENECANGVAKVETQISFVNGLVSSLTAGLFTPMSIKVTCAEASGMSENSDSDLNTKLSLSRQATDTQAKSLFMKAADLAVENGKAVYITFE